MQTRPISHRHLHASQRPLLLVRELDFSFVKRKTSCLALPRAEAKYNNVRNDSSTNTLLQVPEGPLIQQNAGLGLPAPSPPNQGGRRRIPRVLPTTDTAALSSLLGIEIRKAEEVVIRTVGAQGACVALSAIAQVRAACPTHHSCDLAVKPLMLTGRAPPQAQSKSERKKQRGHTPGHLPDRFLMFLRRVPLHADVLAFASRPGIHSEAQQQAQHQNQEQLHHQQGMPSQKHESHEQPLQHLQHPHLQQQPLIARAGSEGRAYSLALLLAKHLLPQEDGSNQLSSQSKPTAHTNSSVVPAVEAPSSIPVEVVAADSDALLRALQGVCLARGRMWKRKSAMSNGDPGLDLLLFVEGPPQPLAPAEGSQKRGGKRGQLKAGQLPGRGGRGGASSEAYMHLGVWLCGKWDWSIGRGAGNAGLMQEKEIGVEDGFIVPTLDDGYVAPFEVHVCADMELT